MEENIICRTCLRTTKNYVSIFSAPELWGKKIVLAKLIMACAPIVIKIGDGLPTKICDNCLQLLQLSFLFRLRVITANENYKEIIRTQVTSSSRMQLVTEKQTTNLNQIYSTEYILESINESAQSLFVGAVKQEPLDIKEELIDKYSEGSPSPASSVQATTSLDKNKLNSAAPNQQEIRKKRKEQTAKKIVTNQIKTQSNDKIYNNSKTKNNGQAIQNRDISFDKIEFSFPNVVNSRLVADNPQNIIIGNEEQIDNELNLKLINNEQRMKRTYSKVDNSKIISSVSKTPKLHDKMKTSFPIDLVDDDKSNLNKQSNNTKSTKTNNSNINECIIIDD